MGIRDASNTRSENVSRKFRLVRKLAKKTFFVLYVYGES
jgi:hypothetical protein